MLHLGHGPYADRLEPAIERAFRSLQSTPLPYSLKVTGFTTVSSAKTKEEDDTSAAIIDNLTFTRGRHTLKGIPDEWIILAAEA